MFFRRIKKNLTLAVILIGFPVTANAVSLSFSTINYPASVLTLIKGVNDNGEFVGEYWDSGSDFHGFYSDGNSMITHDRPTGIWSEAWGINNNGIIAAAGIDQSYHYSGFYSDKSYYNDVDVSGSQFTDLFDINDANMMAGGYGDGAEYRAFIYDLGLDSYTWLNAPGARSGGTSALGINNSGQVAGTYLDSSGISHGYLYDGAFTTIDAPNALWTEALGLNDLGQVVGYFEDTGNILHGYIYNTASLAFTLVDAPGSTGTRVFDINNNGMLVGGYSDASELHFGFTATVIPTPPALWLMGSGLAWLFGMTNIRRRRTVA